MPFPETRQEHARRIVASVRGLAAEGVQAELDASCRGDASLRAEVEHLLREEQSAPTEASDSSGPAPAAARPFDALPGGAWIGPFRIESSLGQGGFGVVHIALDEQGRRVALKTVRVPAAGMLHAIRREIAALSRLRHPGIVPILGHGLHEGLPWYAMALLRGRPIATELGRPSSGNDVSREARLSRVLTLVRRLCGPLAYLHGEGLVHRDLKPDNVLVLEGDVPVIVDFGLASSVADDAGRAALETAGAVAGTPHYMSPEQGRGEPVDARSDLYSLGCLLYELLTGRPPFTGTMAEVLRGHAMLAPPPPSALAGPLAADLDALVLRLLAKDRAARLGYALDAADALARLGALGGSSGEAPRARPYVYRPGLASRGAELSRVAGWLRDAEAGRGGIAFVTGESGIGKTRLVSEVATEARRLAMKVLAGSCLPSTRAPLQGLRGVLEGIADHCRERGDEEARRVLGGSAALLAPYEPSLASLPGGGLEAAAVELGERDARLRLCRELAAILERICGRAGALVVVEDAHWADELTLEVIRQLVVADRLRAFPLLLVATLREDEAPTDLRRLAEADPARRVALGRLDAGGVARIVKDMLAWEDAPRDFTASLERRSRGNPLFVAEYVRAAMEQSLLGRDVSGRWRVADDHALEPSLPPSLEALILVRVASLGSDARGLLDVASVIGREAPVPLLGRAAAMEETELFPALQELLGRHVLEEGRGVSFAHARIREVILGALAADERRRIHRAVAECMEALAAEGRPEEARAAELGLHWEAAGEPVRARACYWRAAREAKERHAPVEATRLLRRYLALVDEPTRESAHAKKLLGRNLADVEGRLDEARLLFEEALAEARALGDLERTSLVLHSLARVVMRKDDPARAAPLLDEALSIARRLGDPKLEAAMLGGAAQLQVTLGRVPEAERLFREVREIQRRIGHVNGEALAVVNLGFLDFRRGRLREAVTLFEEALAAFRDVGNRPQEALTLTNLGAARQLLGELPAARSLYEAALVIAQEVGDRNTEWNLLSNLGAIHLVEGRREDARSVFLRALAIGQEVAMPDESLAISTNLAELERLEGRVPEARELLARTWDAVRGRPDPMVRARVLVLVASLEAWIDGAGQARARTMLEEALEILAPLGAEALAIEVEIAIVQGHVALQGGRSAAEPLAWARALVETLGSNAPSHVAGHLAVLARAAEASGRGEPVPGGYAREDLTPGQIAWLERSGIVS